MGYKNIAVAIDFSDQSKKALERAIEVAKNNQATLQLVHVVDTKTFGSIAAYDLKYAKELKKKAQEDLEQLQNEVKASGVKNVEVVVEEGSPKAILTSLPGVDLIVCGATGLNRVEKMVLGSVAERITRSADCDVFIVR